MSRELKKLLSTYDSIAECDKRIIQYEKDILNVPIASEWYRKRLDITKQIRARLVIRYNRNIINLQLIE